MLKGDDISTAVTALCMWEWFIGCEKDEDAGTHVPEAYQMLNKRREEVGTVALREWCVELAPLVNEAWETFDSIYQGVWSFDWDFVPWFMENCLENSPSGEVQNKLDYVFLAGVKAVHLKHPEISEPKTFTVCIQVRIGEHVVDTVQAVDASEAELKAPKEFAKIYADDFDMHVDDFYDECSVIFVAEGEIKFDIWN